MLCVARHAAVLAGEVKQPQCRRHHRQQPVDSTGPDNCDLETGFAGGFRRGSAHCVNRQAGELADLLPGMADRIGAGEKQTVKLARVRRGPWHGLDLKQRNRERVEPELACSFDRYAGARLRAQNKYSPH